MNKINAYPSNPSFAFRRVLRDCGHNKGETNPRNLIYDFEVVVDGEVRATWHRVFSGKGYELYAPDHESILVRAPLDRDYNPDHMLRARVEKKDDFAATTDVLFATGRIPTAADREQRKLGWGRALLMERDAYEEAARAHKIKDRAKEFFALVDAIASKIEYAGELNARAAALVDAVNADVATSMKFYDERHAEEPLKVAAIAAFSEGAK